MPHWEYAQDLKLDMARFRTCLTSGDYVAEIQQSMEDASSMEVSARPASSWGAVFPNGVTGAKIEGAALRRIREAKIQELLAKTR